MGVPFHTMYAVDGLENFAVFDRVYMGTTSFTYAAGATATATITWTEPIPTTYMVFYSLPERGSAAWTTSQTSTSFVANVGGNAAASLTGGTGYALIVT